MQVTHSSGIAIKSDDFEIVIDPTKVQKTALAGVSHAHSDHTKKHKAEVIATRETADLAGFEFGVNYKQKMKYDDVSISLHNANHVLGSAQFRIENAEVVTYTGDFRLNESLLFEPCEVIDSDTLIIESTYGYPRYHFPSYQEVIDEIEIWVKNNQNKNILFGAYNLGKSQEVVKILNNMDITPVVHPSIANICGIYNYHGYDLEYMSSDSEEAQDAMHDSFVGIFSPFLLHHDLRNIFDFQNSKQTVSATLTGWGNRGHADVNFYLSDHADFDQLMSYVEQSNPKKVYTVHGFDESLAEEITKKLGIPARPLKSDSHILGEF